MDNDNLFIEYNDEKVEFVIEKSKRKSICIIVNETGDVIVRAPNRMPNYEIFEFIKSKKKWIFEKKLEQKSRFRKVTFTQGSELMVLGKCYFLDIYHRNSNRVKLEIINNKIIVSVPENLTNNEEEKIIERAYDKFILNIAKQEIPETSNRISNKVGLYPNELKIRNFKRAWGNCSSKKVISINKDICKFSKDAIEYVCLHEICHLRYMNHSKEFWNMVKKYMPDYKNIEKEIK